MLQSNCCNSKKYNIDNDDQSIETADYLTFKGVELGFFLKWPLLFLLLWERDVYLLRTLWPGPTERHPLWLLNIFEQADLM